MDHSHCVLTWSFLPGVSACILLNLLFFVSVLGLGAIFVVDQLLSSVQFFATSWATACQAPLSFTISWSLFKPTSIESVMSSNHPFLWHPPFLLPSIFLSIRIFSNESAHCIRWPKYWSFNFRISPSNEYSGFISFRIDWFDLFAVQGTPRESSPIPQFKGSKSLMLSLLYGPTPTSVHDYYKSYSFDYTDLCQQSDVSVF